MNFIDIQGPLFSFDRCDQIIHTEVMLALFAFLFLSFSCKITLGGIFVCVCVCAFFLEIVVAWFWCCGGVSFCFGFFLSCESKDIL